MLHALLQVCTQTLRSVYTTQPAYNDKNPPRVFFLSTKIITPFSNRAVCLCEVTRTEAPPTIVDWQKRFSTDCTGVLPQTRPEWAVICFFTTGADVARITPKRLRCFVVGYNNEHSSSHLLPTSERLKRITFDFEWKANSIYLNVSMFARIIRDPASSTEEVNTRFFKWILS